MASKEVLTEAITPADWRSLVDHGVAKAVTPATKRTPGVYTIAYPMLDAVIIDRLVEDAVSSDADLATKGYTMDRLIFEVCGLSDVPENRVSPGDAFPAYVGMAEIVRSRLKPAFDGPVQKGLNSVHGLWLFRGEVVAVGGEKAVPVFAATSDPDMIRRYHVEPDLKSRVRGMKRVSTSALTLMHRVPEVAAEVLASQDRQIAAMAVVRQHNYAEITSDMNAAQRAALDAAISARSTSFAEITREHVLEIEGTTASVSDKGDTPLMAGLKTALTAGVDADN